ncbi:MAG: O-antigen ligase family protein [Ruminococcaceae bacterium]|nr:O-antigen ligase family protein [Oscillospiraceae bacterium]
MEYFLSFLILAFNLFDYEVNVNKYVFLAVSLVILGSLFFVVYKKTGNYLMTCMIMMCHTWQISWVNIFGDPTSALQLPWLYIFGVMVVLYGVFNIRECFKKNYGSIVFMFFIAYMFLFIYPMLIAPDPAEGLKEFIMIGFFVVVLFVCFLFKDKVDGKAYMHFQNSLIWAVFISSLAIVFQWFMYTYAKVSLFKIAIALSFSGYQTNCYLLMEDHSCSTIMLGCAIFYMLDRIDKKRWTYMVPATLTVIIAMALTSRRTSTLSLIVVLAVYVLFHYKGIGKKMLFTVLGIGVGAVMLYYLLIARPVESFSQMLSDNGRYENYMGAVEIIKEHPMGMGYDDSYNVTFMPDHKTTVHNTLLRWCILTGIPSALILVGIIVFVVIEAGKKKLYAEYWAILYTMFASNFIPDILNARFFVIICSVAFLVRSRETFETENAAAAAPEAEKPVLSASFSGRQNNMGRVSLSRGGTGRLR